MQHNSLYLALIAILIALSGCLDVKDERLSNALESGLIGDESTFPAQAVPFIADAVVDASIAEWTGESLFLTDPSGDMNPSGVDLTGIYLAKNADTIFVRIDRRGSELLVGEGHSIWIFFHSIQPGGMNYGLTVYHNEGSAATARLEDVPDANVIESNLPLSMGETSIEVSFSMSSIDISKDYTLGFYTHFTTGQVWSEGGPADNPEWNPKITFSDGVGGASASYMSESVDHAPEPTELAEAAITTNGDVSDWGDRIAIGQEAAGDGVGTAAQDIAGVYMVANTLTGGIGIRMDVEGPFTVPHNAAVSPNMDTVNIHLALYSGSCSGEADINTTMNLGLWANDMGEGVQQDLYNSSTGTQTSITANTAYAGNSLEITVDPIEFPPEATHFTLSANINSWNSLTDVTTTYDNMTSDSCWVIP